MLYGSSVLLQIQAAEIPDDVQHPENTGSPGKVHELRSSDVSIQDILDFAPGTIIELNKIAGEPIDVLVNGKYVAKGEVVVIEESFGIRITEIMK